mgnify:CR=1 FL=1|jgi:hypothetical protein
MSKSRTKDLSKGKSQRSESKIKSKKDDDDEVCTKKSYITKKANGEQTIDATE